MSDFTDFIDVVHHIQDKELLADFLVCITTSKERQELAQRLEIVKQLLAGVPQATIAKNLSVGIATVTRGSKELAQNGFKALRDA